MCADTLLNIYDMNWLLFIDCWFTFLPCNGSPWNVVPCLNAHNPESACIQKSNISCVLSSHKICVVPIRIREVGGRPSLCLLDAEMRLPRALSLSLSETRQPPRNHCFSSNYVVHMLIWLFICWYDCLLVGEPGGSAISLLVVLRDAKSSPDDSTPFYIALAAAQ